MAALFRLNRWAITCALIGIVPGGGCSQSITPRPETPTTATPAPPVPNFAGTWTGTWVAAACTNSPPPHDQFVAWCDGVLFGLGGSSTPPGNQIRFDFALAQSGSMVSGTIRRPSLGDPPPQVVSGSIDDSGAVVLTERYSITIGPQPYSLETDATTWSIRKTADGTLTGTVMIRRDMIAADAPPGQDWAQAEGNIVQASLTGG